MAIEETFRAKSSIFFAMRIETQSLDGFALMCGYVTGHIDDFYLEIRHKENKKINKKVISNCQLKTKSFRIREVLD